MIDYVKGVLTALEPTYAVVEAGGVGYALHIPVSTFGRLKTGAETRLFTHHHQREDAVRLYGFATERERTAFEMLIKVKGIGPQIALAVLSGMTVDELGASIGGENFAALRRVKGVGEKMAKQIVLDLKDSAAVFGSAAVTAVVASGSEGDAIAALVRLGFRQPQAEKAVAKAREKLAPDASVQELIKEALAIGG